MDESDGLDINNPLGLIDAVLRIAVVLGLLGWNAFEALSLRTPYPSSMVALWESPVWRMLLLFIVWVGAEWCPRVGLMTGVAVVMYIVNMIQIV
jgi:hypothetical protein